MSKSKPATREEFIEYGLRRLGHPVIQINVAREQVEDLVDQAITYFQEQHYNGSIQLLYPVAVNAQMLQDRSVAIDDSVIGVHRLIEVQGIGGSTPAPSSGVNPFDPSLMMSQILFGSGRCSGGGFARGGLLTYHLVMSMQSELKRVVSGRTKTIRFNRHMDRVYIEMDWSKIKEGDYFVFEITKALDPEDWPQMWNDDWLKRYFTALVKRQWGNNLKKLNNVQLVGGIQIDGLAIYQEAVEEITALEAEMTLAHQEPPPMVMG